MTNRIAIQTGTALITLLCLFAGLAQAQTHIRLVDAEKGIPLEYWAKDVAHDDGVVFHYRMPSTILVDGKPLPYVRPNAGGIDVDAGQDDPLLELETEKQAGPTFQSDQKDAVETGGGPRAEVAAEFAPGTHTLEPGGKTFTIHADGYATQGDAGLAVLEPLKLRLTCQPVAICLEPYPQAPPQVELTVASGGQVVYEEVLRWCYTAPGTHNPDGPRPRRPVVHLYLPPSDQPYTATTSTGCTVRFLLDNDTLKAVDTEMEDGFQLDCAAGRLGIIHRTALAPRLAPTPTAAAGPELYLFADRARKTFLEGEPAELSVRAYGAPAAAATVRLLLRDSDAEHTLGTVPFERSPAGAFAEAILDTRRLRPGRYVLQARAGETRSNPYPLVIAPALPATNMKIFVERKWGPALHDEESLAVLHHCNINTYSNAIRDRLLSNGSPLEYAMARQAYDKNRYPELQKQPHFPRELVEVPMPTQGAHESLLTHGIGTLPIPYNLILYFGVDEHWEDHHTDPLQWGVHTGMAFRRFPNFLGINHCTGDGPTPATMGFVHAAAGVACNDILHQERFDRLREKFAKQHGELEVDTAGAEKALEMDRGGQASMGLAAGFQMGADVGLAIKAPADRKVLWGRWINDLYPRRFREVRADLAEMIPEPVVTCGTSWGVGARSGMYPATFARDLDFPMNDTHGDVGIANFQYITGTDIYNLTLDVREQRPFVGLDMVSGRSRASAWKLMLQAMSRNPLGVGVLNCFAANNVLCGWADQKDTVTYLAELTEVPKRFGDLFRTLTRRDEIAVLSSFRDEMLGGQRHRHLWNAHTIAQKADYQANVVSDAACEAYPEVLSDRFKAILIPHLAHGLTPALRTALAQFQKKGGLVIADAASEVDLPDVLVLPFAFDTEGGPHNINDHLAYEQHIRPLVKQFREAVAPRLNPWFTTSGFDYTAIRSVEGDLEYWTVFSDKKPWDGKPIDKEAKDYDRWTAPGARAQFEYEGSTGHYAAPRGGVLYDMLRRERVETEPGDTLAWTCDMVQHAGTLYLVADRPLAGLSVSCSKAVPAGSLVTIKAEAVDEEDQPFTGRVPVEFVITNPAGEERYRLYRTTKQPLQLKIALNDRPGQWRWRATDQATGLVAEGEFTVTAGAAGPPAPIAPHDLVSDAVPVHRLLRERAVEIVLVPEQRDLLPVAEALVETLRKHGVRATQRTLWPDARRQYPMQWSYETIEDLEVRRAVLDGEAVGRRVRGKNQMGDTRKDNFGTYAFYNQYGRSQHLVYYRDVILLGRDEDLTVNPLLAEIVRCQMLWRKVSENVPAPGQGLVGYAWSPFHYGHDAVVLYGRGEGGLEQAVAALVELAGQDQPPRETPRPVMGRLGVENGAFYRALGFEADDATAAIIGRKRVQTSLLPRTFSHAVDSVTIADAGRVHAGLVPLSKKETDPNLACIDLAAGAATQYRLADEAGEAGAANLAWHLGPEGRGLYWPPAEARVIGEGFLQRVENGLGLYEPSGKPVWYFDLFDPTGSYGQAKYPEVCQDFTVSADGKTILASFYDMTERHHGGYQIGPGALCFLDAETGQLKGRINRITGSRLALSADGTQATVLDLRDTHHFWAPQHRKYDMTLHTYEPWVWNSHNQNGLAVFGRDGKERFFSTITPPVDRFAVSANGALAIVTYTDARRKISLFNLREPKHHTIPCPATDVAAAVAPDGTYAVVTLMDDTVCRFDPDGSRAWQTPLSAPGVPAVSADSATVAIVCADRSVHLLGSDGAVRKHLPFAGAPAEALRPTPKTPPAGLAAPEPKPFWETLPAAFSHKVLAPGPLAQTTNLAEPTPVTITVPKHGPVDAILFAFRYHLEKPGDTLNVSLDLDGEAHTYHYTWDLLPRRGVVPLRTSQAGTVTLTFQADGPCTLSQGQTVHLRLEDLRNGAFSPGAKTDGKTAFDQQAPMVMIPNFFGLLGDGRCEQMAYGFTLNGGRGNPDPDIPAHLLTETKTNRHSFFDGNVLHGSPLYPSLWRRTDLRSAEIVMTFEKPRTFQAIGLWEDPRELPIESFALECADHVEKAHMTEVLEGKWRPVIAGRGNRDYYHIHAFKPTTARIWRYTILRTPATIQRVAEIELYESVVDAFEADADLNGDDDGVNIGTGGIELED